MIRHLERGVSGSSPRGFHFMPEEAGDGLADKRRAIAYDDGFPSPRWGEGRVRGASIEKRPERAAALTFPLLSNGPLPLAIGERRSVSPICEFPALAGEGSWYNRCFTIPPMAGEGHAR